MKTKPRSVYVVIWDFENSGTTAEVFTTEKAAEDSVWEHVQEYWKQDLGNERMPKDKDAAIRRYFEVTEDSAHIEKCVVNA